MKIALFLVKIISHLIISDEYLRGENQLDDHVIHLLFSTNRWEKADELIKNLVNSSF
jgi:hypothetical protein